MTDGLIALTAGGEGAVARHLADGQRSKAKSYLDRLEAHFPACLYIELSRRGDAIEQAAEPALIDLAYARNLPLVATNPSCYAEPHFTPPTTRCCASPTRPRSTATTARVARPKRG